MTLNDFAKICLSSDGSGAYIYVFEYESSFCDFIAGDKYSEVLCTLHSSHIAIAYLAPEIANAKVLNFCATAKDALAVWIDTGMESVAIRRRASDDQDI